jgi:hypothetical protein
MKLKANNTQSARGYLKRLGKKRLKPGQYVINNRVNSNNNKKGKVAL